MRCVLGAFTQGASLPPSRLGAAGAAFREVEGGSGGAAFHEGEGESSGPAVRGGALRRDPVGGGAQQPPPQEPRDSADAFPRPPRRDHGSPPASPAP